MLREKGLDHSNPNLRSLSKAVEPQPKHVHSGICTFWIFLCSTEPPTNPTISWVAEMSSKLPELSQETLAGAGS